jgi:hypothetical protein
MSMYRDLHVSGLLATWHSMPKHLRNDTNIATIAIKYFLGREWIEKHLDPDATHPGPLTLKGTPLDIELAKIRTVDLAESLFNLRKVEGLHVCVSHLQKARNPEPALAELHIAKMLYANDWQFRFVAPRGKRGDNYDFEIRYWNQTVCGDTKCKIKSPTPDAKTVINTLKASRNQLPPDKPGVFFVKFPQQWMGHQGWERITVDGAIEFFKQGSGRIISVAFYVEPIQLIGPTPRKGQSYFASQGHYFYELANPRRRFCKQLDCKFFEVWRPQNYASWSALPPKYIRLFEFPKGLKGHEKE